MMIWTVPLSKSAANLGARLNELYAENKLVEAQRLEQRVNYDIEMIKEMGYCSGIENYSKDSRKKTAWHTSLQLSWIIFRKISLWWWMNHTLPCLSFAVCILAINPVKKCL